ncbi:MAG: aminotransferase class I/II-fold pyridoxal phosphate-dependent enzyme [Bacteroidota bacterium]
MNTDQHFETLAIRTQAERSQNNEHSVPLYLSSGFIFDTAEDMRCAFSDESDAFVYSRYSNPNNSELVDKLCLLEGAEAGLSMASGMAAIYTTLAALLKPGDHVIACSSVFGATHTILTKYLPRWNIHCSYFAASHPQNIESLIKPETKLIYVETPTNPAIDLIDLEMLGDLAKKNNLILIVDNCFCTPCIQQPIAFGADLVLHSATKYIDGQGRVLGGIVVGRKELIKEIYLFARITGPTLSAFNAWTLSKSIETLVLRMERHAENALYIAQQLENHAALEFVRYPFLPSHPHYSIAKKQMRSGGGIVTISLKGGVEAGKKFLDRLLMIKISPNLGDTRSIATHPASSTHCKLSEDERLAVGILPGLIRLSIGLEHREDILKDILQALE